MENDVTTKWLIIWVFFCKLNGGRGRMINTINTNLYYINIEKYDHKIPYADICHYGKRPEIIQPNTKPSVMASSCIIDEHNKR